MKKLLNIIKNIIYVILVLLLLFTLSSIIISKFDTKFNLYSVQSGSMEPAINVGSIVITKSQEEYKKGNIITFRSESGTGMVITHRITRIDEIKGTKLFYTQGDANNVEDAMPIGEGQIIGKVELSVPLLGYPFAFSKTPIGFVLLIIIPATLIVAGELLNIKNEIKNLREKKNNVEKTD